VERCGYLDFEYDRWLGKHECKKTIELLAGDLLQLSVPAAERTLVDVWEQSFQKFHHTVK